MNIATKNAGFFPVCRENKQNTKEQVLQPVILYQMYSRWDLALRRKN